MSHHLIRLTYRRLYILHEQQASDSIFTQFSQQCILFHIIVTNYRVHSYLRERDSLNTAPAVYRNIILNLCGRKM